MSNIPVAIASMPYILHQMEIYKKNGVSNVHEWNEAEARLTPLEMDQSPINLGEYIVGEYFLMGMYETLGHEAVSSALRELYLLSKPRSLYRYTLEERDSQPITEDVTYRVFLSNVPPGKEEDFGDAWRRLHGGPTPETHN